MWYVLWACSPVMLEEPSVSCEDTVLEEVDTEENVEDTAEEQEDIEEPEEELIWQEATLEILSPEPSAFIPLGEEYLFEAIILDSAGEELEFSEIEWSSSVDSAWSYTSDSFQDELSAGQHAITAQARLPNGDRLSYVVGGVLVQHPNAGIYAGTTSIDITINNPTPLIVSCSGGVTLTVEPSGEIGLGEGDCIVNINGGDIPSTYIFDLEIDETDVGGSAALDLWLIQQEFPLVGTIGNGELTATWSDSILGGYLDVAGTLDLTRVSLY